MQNASLLKLDTYVWRGNASTGRYVHYQVPARKSQTILDVVTWIQRHIEPNLAYRFACRVGMCGSCAMMINGKPRWTCRTHVDKVVDGNRLKIAPLRNLPVIKDLVTDMTEFFDKWNQAQARFHPSLTRNDDIEKISAEDPKRKQASAAIECINCAVCYAACDVVTTNPAYLGPAALNRVWTLVNDVRDSGQKQRLGAIAGTSGCFNCHTQQSCRTYCPNDLNPTASIAGLKRTVAKAVLKRQI